MTLDLDLYPEGSGPTPDPVPPRPSRTRLWLALIGCLVVLGLGVWFVSSRLSRWLNSTPSSASPSATTGGGAADTRRIQATLFYVSADGAGLVPVTHDVVFAATPAEQARRIVEAQVAPPPNERVSAIPKGTTVRAVFLTNGHQAYVDLGGAIASGQTGGSLDEALTVYAIVNAVITNLPDITGVQILVDGKEVDSLAGHLDLREPLGKTTDWFQKGP
ncbi:MAG: GerMN domain-containing protein [Acidobacteriota bacterium]